MRQFCQQHAKKSLKQQMQISAGMQIRILWRFNRCDDVASGFNIAKFGNEIFTCPTCARVCQTLAIHTSINMSDPILSSCDATQSAFYAAMIHTPMRSDYSQRHRLARIHKQAQIQLITLSAFIQMPRIEIDPSEYIRTRVARSLE